MQHATRIEVSIRRSLRTVEPGAELSDELGEGAAALLGGFDSA